MGGGKSTPKKNELIQTFGNYKVGMMNVNFGGDLEEKMEILGFFKEKIFYENFDVFFAGIFFLLDLKGGNWCYAITILQSLFYIDDFREKIENENSKNNVRGYILRENTAKN